MKSINFNDAELLAIQKALHDANYLNLEDDILKAVYISAMKKVQDAFMEDGDEN